MEYVMFSPKIIRQEWGSVEVEGHGRFKDARLFPGGAREWDWAEFGTRHTPGVGIQEVEELIAHGATTVILSRGVQEHLQVPQATVAFLRAKGIAVEVLQTELATARYNELCERSEAVAALIHSTC